MPAAKTATPAPARAPATPPQASLYQQLRGHLAELKLHDAARLRWDKRTQDYVKRRVTEGKTRREAIRCLKRYICREIYHDITTIRNTPPTAQPAP